MINNFDNSSCSRASMSLYNRGLLLSSCPLFLVHNNGPRFRKFGSQRLTSGRVAHGVLWTMAALIRFDQNVEAIDGVATHTRSSLVIVYSDTKKKSVAACLSLLVAPINGSWLDESSPRTTKLLSGLGQH